MPSRTGGGVQQLERTAPQKVAVLAGRPKRDGRGGQRRVVQCMDALGRRSGEHVREVFVQEQADIITRGAVPVNRNHRYKLTRCAHQHPCAKIPLIVNRLKEVRPMNAVSVMGAPPQSTIRG